MATQPPGQQQQQFQQQPHQLTLHRRRCAEVCLDLLLNDAVRLFSDPQAGIAPSAASLEAVGLRVGRQLAERYTKDKPRLGDTLEIIKFICKEFWQSLWKKQVDNLRTNHRGIYVLQDNCFRWLQRLAPAGPSSGPPDPARDEAMRRLALDHLHLPCGIIRGALCHLGVPCVVEADPKVLPACAFTVRIV